MAKRYGVLPSQIKNLGATDFTFNLFVMGVGVDDEIKAQKKGQRGRS